MRLVTGKDLFEEELGRAHVLLVTTNSIVQRDGRLVMGTGAALRAKQECRSQNLPHALGLEIRRQNVAGGVYGVIVLPPTQWTAVEHGKIPTAWGAFQVKRDWRQPADPELIAESTRQLAEIAERLPNWRFAMNEAGTGAGRLDQAVVRPILEQLPDNVWVYRHA